MLTLFPPDKRGGVFAVFGVVSGLAVVAGPTLGGFLTTNFGWRWIFYVNIPVGIAVLIAALVLIPDLRPGRRHRLDIPGVLIATAGLFCLVFGLIEGQRFEWGTVTGFITIPEMIGLGALLMVAFLVYQARRQDQEPLLPFAVFKDRNFTLMAVVLSAMGFAILGYFLPLTIYLQSVLGLSALDAGLTTAAQPLTMMVVSGVAGSIVQRVGGKYLLIPGLTLFAIGTAWIAWVAQPDSNRWIFLPGLIVSGVGMGMTWTPIYSLATRDLKPELAGVASGVLNTIQELGAVIASASVGALLQNRLATAMHDQAVQRSTELPPQVRDGFVKGFSGASRSGFEVGAGENGSALAKIPGVPAEVVRQIGRVAHEVFTNSFVSAMRPALILTIGVILLAALLCFGVRQRSSNPRTESAGEAVAA
jgi:EmrB/QacA subfamily drug resistance transporter